MTTNVFYEGRHTGEYIKSEAKGSRSRDNVVIAAGSGIVVPGAVLGQILFGAATIAAAGGNTGNGVVSAVTLGPKVKAGVYTVKFTGATAFQVTSPHGVQLAPGTAAGAYGVNPADPEVNFTFTAGATPMAAGDSIAINVPQGSLKYKPCVANATDGSAIAAAINYARVDATSVDVPATATTRDSEVYGQRLTLDASIGGTPSALAAAVAQLTAQRIILR